MERLKMKMKVLTQSQRNKLQGLCHSKGIFNDDYWQGKVEIIQRLEDYCQLNGLELQFENSTYNGLQFKEWTYNVTDGRRSGKILIRACFCGSVINPMSRYDIVSTVY